MMFRQAVLTQSRRVTCRTMPSPSQPQPMSARWSQKTPTAFQIA